jgi:hypothetical protein
MAVPVGLVSRRLGVLEQDLTQRQGLVAARSCDTLVMLGTGQILIQRKYNNLAITHNVSHC